MLVFLAATPAYPSGFQVMTQDARATGMGLAFTAVADNPAAIFYNPAGLAWQKHFGVSFGGSLATRTNGDFAGADPYPGVGDSESLQHSSYFLPTLYVVAPLTTDINFGLGIFAPYGLGYRWANPDTFSGRFISQYSYIQSSDINPVISFQATPSLALAVGADYRLSKVQLERNLELFPNSNVDIAHVKLNSDLTSNHGWGWNAGIMIRPTPQFSLGAAYRSSIKVDYSGDATFTQILTGNPSIDAAVAATLPPGTQPANTSIDFPSSLNIGMAVMVTGGYTMTIEADWTEWSKFHSLNITFPNLPAPNTCQPVGSEVCRVTNWSDSWAYRIGFEKKFSTWVIRSGYYYDNTPQPVEDAGPLLSDSDREGYSIGVGFGTERWGIDISDLYLKFKDRNTQGSNSTDNFYGVYQETANIVALTFRFAF